MKKILFIHPGQFGTQTSTYNYCLLLKEKYKINYIGIDEGLANRNIKGIKYIHIPQATNGCLMRLNFFKAIYREVHMNSYDFVLVNYFIFCSIIRLFIKRKIVVEIRSGYIFSSFLKRFFYNMFLFIEVKFFKNITTISQGIVKYLNLPARTSIIPLGSPKFAYSKKDFKELKFLYVGTFHERNITTTIKAFAQWYFENINRLNVSYTIIGHGSKTEVEKIKNMIKELKIDKIVSYKGEIREPKIAEYFNSHNVGVSYIPIKKYFENQPPFKTFEYLLSGMPVLATATNENIKVINDANGVIIGDTVEDFYNGLIKIYTNINTYSSEKIQKQSQKYSWDYIVTFNLIPYIERVSC
ncbi:MAG: glycosyltransferase [Melioribacteraceae bacterium]